MGLHEGPIRRRLREWREKGTSTQREVPKIPRKVLEDLIFDEEKAHAEYMQIVDKMAPGGPYEGAAAFREAMWGIAQDESRHAQLLVNMLQTLEREGKVLWQSPSLHGQLLVEERVSVPGPEVRRARV